MHRSHWEKVEKALRRLGVDYVSNEHENRISVEKEREEERGEAERRSKEW